MAYTPPTGTAANFNFNDPSYIPPTGNAVAVEFADTMLGSIDISITMSATLLPPQALRGAINTSITLSGALLQNTVTASSMFLLF